MQTMRITYRLMLVPDNELLKLWSEATRIEEHLIEESPDSLRNGVMAAIVAFDDDKPVGFAGLMNARTRTGHELWWRDRKVVELGGVYVHPDYRNHGIWRQMLLLRVDFAAAQTWHVVCVTTNEFVMRGMEKLRGARLIEDSELKAALCIGCSNAARCGFCPLRTAVCYEVM